MISVIMSELILLLCFRVGRTWKILVESESNEC